jgi:hypothetical protein
LVQLSAWGLVSLIDRPFPAVVCGLGLIVVFVTALGQGIGFSRFESAWPWVSVFAGVGLGYITERWPIPTSLRTFAAVLVALVAGSGTSLMDPVAGQTAISGAGESIRVNGTLRSTIDLSALMAISLLYLLSRIRHWKSKTVALAGLCVAALFLSMTRAALVGLIVGLVVLIVQRQGIFSRTRIRSLLIFLGVTMVIAWGASRLYPVLIERLLSTGGAEDISATTKLQILWPRAVEALRASPPPLSSLPPVLDNTFLTLGVRAGLLAVVILGVGLAYVMLILHKRHQDHMMSLVAFTIVFASFLDAQNFSYVGNGIARIWGLSCYRATSGSRSSLTNGHHNPEPDVVPSSSPRFSGLRIGSE